MTATILSLDTQTKQHLNLARFWREEANQHLKRHDFAGAAKATAAANRYGALAVQSSHEIVSCLPFRQNQTLLPKPKSNVPPPP